MGSRKFFKHSLKYEFSLIEGAMGLFDGLGQQPIQAQQIF